MANWYVNKSGNDSNGGGSHSDAFLTIQKAYDSAGTGDIVNIGSGVYHEFLQLGSRSIEITFLADGHVVCDGSTFIVGTYFLYGGAITRLTLNGVNVTNFQGLSDTGANRGPFKLFNLYIDGDICLSYGSYAIHNDIHMKNVVHNGALVRMYRTGDDNPTATTKDVVFESCSFLKTGWFDSYWSIGLIFQNCHFVEDIDFGTVHEIRRLEECNFNGSVAWKGVTYPTIADFQTAYPELVSGCINKPAVFNPDYTLHWTSPNVLSDGTWIGAKGPASYYDSADELFRGALLNKVFRNDFGDFELLPGETVGTVTTVVMDFGKDELVNEINITASESYGTDVIDSSTLDSAPNRLTFEYRSRLSSEGSFNIDDTLTPWQEAERGVDLNLTCRYFQMRFTLRNDGVAS
ncbi:hypothetical protein [Acinetobacter sp.]|uniref:hypothetical protein n=1 Tax=Acinetobacter sp. TaxID=472 RepID=UPI003D07BE55